MVPATMHPCSVHARAFSGSVCVTAWRCVQDRLWEELSHSLAKRMVQAFLSASLVSSLRPGIAVTLCHIATQAGG